MLIIVQFFGKLDHYIIFIVKLFSDSECSQFNKFCFSLKCIYFRYITTAPAPYDPYGGYPVPQVQMPTPAPIPAPAGYAPVQVMIIFYIILYSISGHFTLFAFLLFFTSYFLN